MFDVQRSDVAKPVRGGIIQLVDKNGQPIPDGRFAINGGPELDSEGLTWSCPAQPA